MARKPGMYSYRGMRGLGQGMYQDATFPDSKPMQGLGQASLSTAQANAASRALEQRELVKANIGENIWTDLTSGKTYKISPFTITNRLLTGWTGTVATTVTTEQTLGTYSIPVGTELMFAKPRFARGDIESPHIFASVIDNASPAVAVNVGVFRVRVFDSQNHFEKFIPLEISLEKLNAASAIDIDQRVYFNSQTPGRAVAGDTVRFTLDPQSVAIGQTVDLANSTVVAELIRLSVLAG